MKKRKKEKDSNQYVYGRGWLLNEMTARNLFTNLKGCTQLSSCYLFDLPSTTGSCFFTFTF